MNNDRLYCFLYRSFRQPHFLPGFCVRPAAVCFQNLFFLLHFHFADFQMFSSLFSNSFIVYFSPFYISG